MKRLDKHNFVIVTLPKVDNIWKDDRLHLRTGVIHIVEHQNTGMQIYFSPGWREFVIFEGSQAILFSTFGEAEQFCQRRYYAAI